MNVQPQLVPDEVSDQKSVLITAVLCGAAFMAMVDVFVVNVAFPRIGAEFSSASFANLSWILNGYTIIYAALLIPFGGLADKWGRKSAFLIGLSIFTVASVACAASPSLWTLILSRVLQAVGAAMLTPSSLGLILTVLPAHRRAGAVKAWATTSAIAAAVGPVLGGVLTEYSWRWIFIINLPVGILAVFFAATLIPATKFEAKKTAFPDLVGSVLIAAAVGSLSLALVEAEREANLSQVGYYVLAVLCLAWLARRIISHPNPIVAPSLFKVPTFVWANVTIFVFCTAFAAAFLSVAIWLQTATNFSVTTAGVAQAPGPIVVFFVAYLTQKLAHGVSPRLLVVTGNLIFAAGALWLALAASTTPNYSTDILPAWMVIGLGIGIGMPTMIASATRDLPGPMTATGSGVVNTSRQLGYVLGVAILVAITGSLNLSPSEALPVFQMSWALVAAGAVLSAVAAFGMRGST